MDTCSNPTYCFQQEIDSLAVEIDALIKEKGLNLAVAESCTGGNISRTICSIPGCSEYYLGGVTSYANSVKISVLGVPVEIIETYGAVSCECAEKMAEGVCKQTGSDIGLATSGIAGPGGGTEEKPVGLVCIGICSPKGLRSLTYQHSASAGTDTPHANSSSREENILAFTAAALRELRKELLSE